SLFSSLNKKKITRFYGTFLFTSKKNGRFPLLFFKKKIYLMCSAYLLIISRMALIRILLIFPQGIGVFYQKSTKRYSERCRPVDVICLSIYFSDNIKVVS